MAVQEVWQSNLEQVWRACAGLPVLGDVASVHGGIVPIAVNRDRLVSSEPREGFVPGLMHINDGFEPFFVRGHVYIPANGSLVARHLPWKQHKVLANATRLTKGPWVIAGAPDRSGLLASQRFHGIWPLDDLPVDVLAALISGPLANAFLGEHQTSRDNRITVLRSLPIPRITDVHKEEIAALVRHYRSTRTQWLATSASGSRFEHECRDLLIQIDAVLLREYDLPPRAERQLLQYFAGADRPGPVAFSGYYASDFQPALPWHMRAMGMLAYAGAQRTLTRLPVLSDRVISDALADL